MGFSLKKFFEEASAQVNPFDGGKTAQTVRNSRAVTPPAQTRSNFQRVKAQLNPLDNGLSWKTDKVNFGNQEKERQNDARLRDSVRQARQMVNTGQITPNQARGKVLSDAAAATAKYQDAIKTDNAIYTPGQKIINIATSKQVAPVALGITRSAIGTGEGLSGLYDGLTPGKGTNRFGKALIPAGAKMDSTVADNGYNKWAYRGSQVGTDLATFAIGGAPFTKAVSKAGTVASKLPYAGRAINYVDDLAKYGTRGQKLAAKGAQYLARPDVASDMIVDTALAQGFRTNRGQDVSPGTIAQDVGTSLLFAGGLAGVGAGAKKLKGVLPDNVAQKTKKVLNPVQAQFDEHIALLEQSKQGKGVKAQKQIDKAIGETIKKRADFNQRGSIGFGNKQMDDVYGQVEKNLSLLDEINRQQNILDNRMTKANKKYKQGGLPSSSEQDFLKAVDQPLSMKERALAPFRDETGSVRLPGASDSELPQKPSKKSIHPSQAQELSPEANLGKGVKSSSKGSIDPLESLKQEARKYKSAEEFVKAQGEPLYHGTTEKIQGDFKYPLYTTPKKDYAQVFADSTAASSISKSGKKLSDAPMVHEFAVNPKARVLDITNPAHRKLLEEQYFGKYSMSYDPVVGKNGHIDWTEGENLAEWIDENKLPFDAIKLDEGGGGIDPSSGLPVIDKGVSYMALNNNALRSKQQLTDLWNEATQSQPPKSTKKSLKDKLVAPFKDEVGSVGRNIRDGEVNRTKLTDNTELRQKGYNPEVLDSNQIVNPTEQQVPRLGKQKQQQAALGTSPSKSSGGLDVSTNQQVATKQQLRSQSQRNQISPEELSSKTRGFVKSVLEDPNTSPKVKESISSLYTVRNTKELQVKAANLVKQNRDVAVQLSQNASDDTSVAVAQELIKTLQKEGNYTQAVDLVEKLAEDLTKAGQTVQAASIYGKLTPEGVLRFTQKEINRYNKATGKNIKLDPSKAEKLKNLADGVQKMPEGYDKQVAIAKLVKEIQTTMPATRAEQLSTLQTMAQLLNPKTNIRNIGGNTIFAGLENVSQTVATPVDKLLSMFTGSRTTSLPSLKTQLKSGKVGGKRAIKEAYQGINTGASTQFDLNDVPTFRNGVLSNLEKTMNATLRGADRAAYEAAFDDTVRSMMKSKGLKTVTPEILEEAHHQGLYRTFQDSNAISDTFVNLKRTLNKIGIGTEGKKFGLGDVVLKYPKTPANLLARGIDYSPAGFIKATFEASKPLFGKSFDQKKFVDAFSRAVVGSGAAFGMGYILSDNGIITAQPEENKDLRNLQKTAGLGGYQINASAFKRWVASGFNKDAAKLREGDQLVSYDWAQPVAIPVSAGAALGADKPTRAGQEAGNTLASSANTLVEQPLLQGIQRLFNSNQSIPQNLVDSAQQIPASFTPTALSQVNQFLDNTSRSTKTDSTGLAGFLEGSANQVKAKVPGLAQTLPAQADVLGNPRERYQGGSNNAFNVFLNPAFMSNYKPSEAARETQSIYQNSGETKQAPNTVPNSIKVNGENKQLGGEDQFKYQSYVGKNNSDTFDIITKDPRYQALSDTDRASILSSLQSDVNSAGKITLFGDKPEKVSTSVDAIATGNLRKAIDLKLSGRTGVYTEPSPQSVTKLKSWLPSGTQAPSIDSKISEQIDKLEKDFKDGKVGKIGYEEKKKTLLKASFQNGLTSDEKLILGSSVSKSELKAAIESGSIDSQSIERALAVEKKMFDAGLIQKEYLANKLGLAARGYKGRSGGSKKGSKGSKGKSYDYKLYGFGKPAKNRTGELQSLLEKYIA